MYRRIISLSALVMTIILGLTLPSAASAEIVAPVQAASERLIESATPEIEVTVWNKDNEALHLDGISERYVLKSAPFTGSSLNKVRIRNVGTMTLFIFSVTLQPIAPDSSTPMSLQGLPGQQFTVFPGSEEIFYIKLGPASQPGRYRAEFTIHHNDGSAYKLRPEGSLE